MPVFVQTIEQYQALSPERREALLKAMDTDRRLEAWLGRGEFNIPEEEPCHHCHGGGVLYHKKRDDSDIHPSAISRCLKALWYASAGYAQQKQRRVSATLRIIFDIGSAWHAWVQENYGKRGAWGNPNDYYPEVPIDPDATEVDAAYPLAAELRIKGHIDAIVDNYCVGQVVGFGGEMVYVRVVHEYKTINDNGFKGLTKPKSEHEEQATPYAVLTNIPFTSFIYFNKNGGAFCGFNTAVNLDVWAKIRKKCERVLELAKTSTPPPWEETSAVLDGWECKDCDYAHLCKPYDRLT